MEAIKYQTWEDELEAPELDRQESSIVAIVFAACCGMFIFLILLVRASFSAFLSTGRSPKRNAAQFNYSRLESRHL